MDISQFPEEQSKMLSEKMQRVTTSLQELAEYQENVRARKTVLNKEFYAALEANIKAAGSALHIFLFAINEMDRSDLTSDEISLIGQNARRQSIADLARARQWEWHDGFRCWIAPNGAKYNESGEAIK